jgi:hypothetical protein
VKVISTPSSFEPLSVKLFSCARVLSLPRPAAVSIRSQTQIEPHGNHLGFEQGRRHAGMLLRHHATQFTKNRMPPFLAHDRFERVDQLGREKPESRAILNRPKPKKLSMHSE